MLETTTLTTFKELNIRENNKSHIAQVSEEALLNHPYTVTKAFLRDNRPAYE